VNSRGCPFCGATERLTKEDAWPRWLNRALPPPSGPGTAYDISLDGTGIVRSSRRTVIGYNTARVGGFCATCNNGWMSQLEQAAAPLLLPMICGQSTVLDRTARSVVANWVTKTALVFDQRVQNRTPFESAETTQWFGKHRQPIAGSRVLLGRYSGNHWRQNHTVSALPAAYPDGTVKNIVVIVTLCLGELVMQLICPTEPAETSATRHLGRNDETFAVQIQPATDSSASWPPAVAMTSQQWFEFGLTKGSAADVEGIFRQLDEHHPNKRGRDNRR
jgi:hypothetical protein